MSDIVIVISREKFKYLERKDVVSFIRKNLSKAEKTLKAEKEDFLREKITKLEGKLKKISSEIEELREFYEKALWDKKLMMAERDKLRKENEELKKKLKGKRAHKS